MRTTETLPVGPDGSIPSVQTIDLYTDRATRQRYELSVRCRRHGAGLTAWTVELAGRTPNGHIETLFSDGRALLTSHDAARHDAARPDVAHLDLAALDAAYRCYVDRWARLLAAGPGRCARTEAHHHRDALVQYWNTWRSGPEHRPIIDRLASFTTITVLALDTDLAIHVVQRAAAHHPRPVTLAIYRAHTHQLDFTLVDTASIEALIADPAPLRAEPGTAGALLTGAHAATLLHPGSIGAIATGRCSDR